MDKQLIEAARNVHEAATPYEGDNDWKAYGRLWVSVMILGQADRVRFVACLAEIGAVAWARHAALWPEPTAARCLAEHADGKDPVGSCYEAVGRLASGIERVASEIRMRDKKTALCLADVAAVAVRSLADLDL